MNGKIAFFIWLKGLALFVIACLLLGVCGMLFNGGFFSVFLVSIAMVVLASIISSPAILVYTVGLHLMKRAKINYQTGMACMIMIAAPLAVTIADLLLFLFGANKEDVFSYLFWIPLLLCMVSILISRKKIALYLQPTVATQLLIIE